MFRIVQSIIELLQNSVIRKMQLRAERKVYRCVWWDPTSHNYHHKKIV